MLKESGLWRPVEACAEWQGRDSRELVFGGTSAIVVQRGNTNNIFIAFLFFFQFAVSALTWGHNDKRLFLATGNTIHIGWVCRKVASLQLLSRLAVSRCLAEESQVKLLPIPRRLKSLVHYLFAHTIRVRKWVISSFCPDSSVCESVMHSYSFVYRSRRNFGMSRQALGSPRPSEWWMNSFIIIVICFLLFFIIICYY